MSQNYGGKKKTRKNDPYAMLLVKSPRDGNDKTYWDSHGVAFMRCEGVDAQGMKWWEEKAQVTIYLNSIPTQREEDGSIKLMLLPKLEDNDG